MKPDNPKTRNGRPLPPPCGWCGSQLTRGRCVPCGVKALYYVSLLLERTREEERKRFWLTRLQFALAGASRFLSGFDTTAIEQAIRDARLARGVQEDNKEENNAS